MNGAVQCVIVQTTVAAEADAQRLAKDVVERHLAACVQIEPIRSIYRWRGALEETGEFRLSCKTTQARCRILMKTLRAMHPYELPELIVIPVLDGDADYLNWISGELAGDELNQDGQGA